MLRFCVHRKKHKNAFGWFECVACVCPELDLANHRFLDGNRARKGGPFSPHLLIAVAVQILWRRVDQVGFAMVAGVLGVPARILLPTGLPPLRKTTTLFCVQFPFLTLCLSRACLGKCVCPEPVLANVSVPSLSWQTIVFHNEMVGKIEGSSAPVRP